VNCIELFDDGQHDDVLANDGIFGTVILGLDAGQTIDYFVEATDAATNMSRFPRCGMESVVIGSANFDLAINEIMASNGSIIADEEGEFDDWLEIHNFGNDPVFLGDKYLSDDAEEPNKWSFPEITIQPGEFLLFWADDDEEQGEMHTNFKLSAGGEFIGIFDTETQNFGQIDGLNFGEQEEDAAFGRVPNGTGVFQEVTPTPAASNEPLSVSQVFGNELITLNTFPSPFQEDLKISLTTTSIKPFQISIKNAIGQTVFENEKTFFDTILEIPTTNWSAGLYFVSLSQNNQPILVDKILLQR